MWRVFHCIGKRPSFQAETMSETFPAAGPVKVKVLGEEDKDKLKPLNASKRT